MRNPKGTRLISMSLYGDLDMYIKGAKVAVETYKQFYPNWDLRIYCSEQIDLDCEVVVMGESHGHSGMFWRFKPIWEEGINRVIVRDTDSRFSYKETAAVQAWIESGKVCHSMHDHEHHRSFPLFGGMFGMKCNVVQDMSRKLRIAMNLEQARVDDMKWLQRYLWPYVGGDTLHHSSVPLKWEWKEFPLQEEGHFIGQQHGDDGPIWR